MTSKTLFVALIMGAGACVAPALAAQERQELQERQPAPREEAVSAAQSGAERATVERPAIARVRRAPTRKTVPLDAIEPSPAQREALETRAAAAGRITRQVRPLQEQVALDDFPFQAQDLAANERVFRGKATHNPDNPNSTWQQYAYDLGVSRRQPDGHWQDFKPTIDWKDPKNADYYIYETPVYAVSDGVVVNCWRNAPENPRPFSGELDDPPENPSLSEQTWLHEDTRAGKVHGSGNFIMVREDNGNIVHYAHGKPGTVPENLCPHNDVHLSPASWENDSAVPPAQQADVKRGDFLFRVGNTGTSSAPHLHIDRTMPDKATSLQLRFRHGLANPLTGFHGELENDEWTSFAGQQIPPGPVLVWPPRRGGGLWSWHGMDAKTWGAYFRHMADSDYWMTWIDGYSVAGKPYFNTIWRPAKSAWYGYALLTPAEYQAKFDEHTGDGFALVHVDSVLSGGKPRYDAIFVKGASMDFVARHGQNNADFNATFQDLTGKGYVAVNASVIPVGGNLQYTTLYRKENLGGWVLLPGIAKGDYQKVYDENAALGRYPYYVNAFKHGSGVYYSVVFSQKPAGPRKDRHGMSPGAYQSEFNSAGALAIQALSGVDNAAANHEYIAIWRKEN